MKNYRKESTDKRDPQKAAEARLNQSKESKSRDQAKKDSEIQNITVIDQTNMR